MNPIPFEPSFFAQPTVHVARQLLGARLFATLGNLEVFAFEIVETEAYTQNDPACHAYRGNKGRGAALYEPPGLAYVYLIYGMYHCLNVVTEAEGVGAAVLFRALAPLNNAAVLGLKTNGPGRLCKALQVNTQTHNGINLCDAKSPLYLSPGTAIPDEQVVVTTRIGIRMAVDYPWRFYKKDCPFVSVK